MWALVNRTLHTHDCVEHRGRISTALTPNFKFGVVTVADSTCGNGSFVLAKRRHQSGARWRIRGAGSDWGNPDRCAGDLRKIPRPVLEDFFSAGICAS
jgi:hypothetical protein